MNFLKLILIISGGFLWLSILSVNGNIDGFRVDGERIAADDAFLFNDFCSLGGQRLSGAADWRGVGGAGIVDTSEG